MVEERFFDEGKFFYCKEALRFIKKQVLRVEQKKASLIIIDGGLGNGKTTLSVHIADAINKEYGLPLIDLKGSQYSFGGEKFASNISKTYINKLPAIIYDEAGDFSKRSVLTKFNRNINRIFETFRTFKVIVIVVLPSFYTLDNSIFDNQVPRGLFHCYKRTKNRGIVKVFGLNRMNYMRFFMKKSINKSFQYISTRANFHLHFKDLDPDRSRLLDKISTAEKIGDVIKKDIDLNKLINCKDLGITFNYTIGKIKTLLKEGNIKPDRTIGTAHYYERDKVIPLINNLIKLRKARFEDYVKKRQAEGWYKNRK